MLISKFDTTNVGQYVRDYEENNMFTFPDQYKEFLMKYNGGYTPVTEFRIAKISSDLEGFFGVGNADEILNYSLFDSMNRINDFLENNMLPIGTNAFGDYVTIGVGTENTGKVYFLYHDRPAKYIELTEDFRTFVSKCRSRKIGHIRTIEERTAMFIANFPDDEITQETICDWQAEIDVYGNMNQEELVF